MPLWHALVDFYLENLCHSPARLPRELNRHHNKVRGDDQKSSISYYDGIINHTTGW